MFTKIKLWFSSHANLAKIKELMQTSYVSIVKLHVTLIFIQDQITDTKLGEVLKEYLPDAIDLLGKLEDLFEKYGKYIGLDQSVIDQESLNEANLIAELKKSVKDLHELPK